MQGVILVVAIIRALYLIRFSKWVRGNVSRLCVVGGQLKNPVPVVLLVMLR